MNKRTVFFIILIGCCLNFYAQTRLTVGENEMENKRIDLKDDYLTITPVIKYVSNYPRLLTIDLKLELFDKNNNPK